MKFPDRHSLPDIDTYLELSFDQFKLIGRSVAGVETVFSIPQFNVTFDTGRAPHFAYGMLSHADFQAAHQLHIRQHLSQISVV